MNARPAGIDKDATFVEGRYLLDAGPSEKGWSRVEAFTRCPQLAAYIYELHLALAVNEEPLVRGALGHIGLAHHYRRQLEVERRRDPEVWHTPADAVRILADRPGGPKGSRDYGKDLDVWRGMVPLVLSLLEAYAAKYRREPYAVVAVEKVVRMNITDEVTGRIFPYTQRLDLALETAAGRVRIVDHKIVGHASAQTLRDYTLSGQFLGYHTIGRALWGDRFDGVYANLIGVEDGKKFAFRRGTPELAPWATACHGRAVVDAELEWERLRAEGRDPWRYPKRLNVQICRGLYGDCPGREHCRWGSSEA